MKKNYGLIIILCGVLTACETVSDMSWPSFGLFGEEGADSVTEVVMDDMRAPVFIPEIDQAALTTELDEMEKLTGTRPQMRQIMPKETVAEAPVIEPMPMAEDITPPTPQIQEDIAQDQIEEIVETVTEDIAVEAEIVKTPEPVEPIAVIENARPMQTEAGCPSIIMVPATKSMSKFDPENPSRLIARASMTDVRGGCEFVKDGMEVDLDILMRGTITNQGRFEGNRNQEAFVSFPYFITVLNPDGAPVNKQILATALRFRPNVDFLDHAEKITQYIPMDNPEQSSGYTISVGFQLNRDQLDYNQALSSAKPDNVRVSPDTSPTLKRSYNPLADE